MLRINNLSDKLIYGFPLERYKLDILYKAVWLVDVIIPRWWSWLIQSVREKSIVPVIETWAWVVHLYLDNKIKAQNYNKVLDIIINSKVSRPSVCNALDTLVINENTTSVFIEKVIYTLDELWVNILIWAADYDKEQLGLSLNIKYVDSISEGIKHIQKYSSRHSDWIISDDKNNISLYNSVVDSSVVYTNTSTRFSDWSCFWLAWEIWISTQKLHARWPMWAESLVTYKYKIVSEYKSRN